MTNQDTGTRSNESLRARAAIAAAWDEICHQQGGGIRSGQHYLAGPYGDALALAEERTRAEGGHVTLGALFRAIQALWYEHAEAPQSEVA